MRSGPIEAMFPDARSDRSKRNKVSMIRAVATLGTEDGGFRWLHDPEGRIRGTILAELGRIPDGETMRTVARRLCELRPRTADAVSLIRRFRGAQRPPSTEGLRLALRGTINAWFRRHPAASWGQALEALALATQDVTAGRDAAEGEAA